MGNKKQSPQTATEPEKPAPNKPKKPALKRYYND